MEGRQRGGGGGGGWGGTGVKITVDNTWRVGNGGDGVVQV